MTQACQQSIPMQYRIDFPMENTLFEFQGSHYDVNVRIEGPEIDALKSPNIATRWERKYIKHNKTV